MTQGRRRTYPTAYDGLQSLGVALLLVAGAAAYFFYALPRHRALPAAAGSVVATNGTPRAELAAPPPQAKVTTTRAANAPLPFAPAVDDATLMTQLRALVGADPEQALTLARHGDALFPNSPEAAERSWCAVKSLTQLKRFHEAQAEARLMLERYPGTPWTDDAERHTLVYPLDQPSREEQQAAAER